MFVFASSAQRVPQLRIGGEWVLSTVSWGSAFGESLGMGGTVNLGNFLPRYHQCTHVFPLSCCAPG